MAEVADGKANVEKQVRAWLAASWNPELPLREWRELLVLSGWAVPSWPEQWFGRGLPGWADDVVRAELASAGAVSTPVGGGMSLAAPTILTHGPGHVRERFLHPILTGAETWCQLFSEPGAGSDLAGLRTTAELDGDEWVVSGQKVWNTSAQHADFGLLVARSDWGVPKHSGLTYFVLPMDQPGVEVRPLRQMNNHSSFNEVFMLEARIPGSNVVGAVSEGWKVALTTLAFERRFGNLRRPNLPARQGTTPEGKAQASSGRRRRDLGSPGRGGSGRGGPDLGSPGGEGPRSGAPRGGGPDLGSPGGEGPRSGAPRGGGPDSGGLVLEGRAVAEARVEADEYLKTYVWYPQRAGRADLVEDRARAHGRETDPLVRQEIAKLVCINRASRWTADRAQAARALGRAPGAEGSIGKLSLSNVARQGAKVHSMIAGANAMLAGADSPMSGLIHEILVSVPAQSIAGGTDEIQRNIIGEKVLGLPREPSPDKTRPFRDIPT